MTWRGQLSVQEYNIRTSMAGVSYLETIAKAAESDLLQPGLDFAGLPVGHAGRDTPRHFLSHHSQRALAKGRRCAVAGVHDDSL